MAVMLRMRTRANRFVMWVRGLAKAATRDRVSSALELSGAAAFVVGIDVLAGDGWALVVAGGMSMVFGLAMGGDGK